jgi:HAD superfamily hydrolase (TIGR01490 family)
VNNSQNDILAQNLPSSNTTSGNTPSAGTPSAAPNAPVNIVALDFDDTILEGHSPVRMVTKLSLRGTIPFSVALKTTVWGLKYKMHMPVEQAIVRKYIFEGFSRYTAEKANQIIADFYAEDLRERLRPKALQIIEQHRAQGDKIVIVSASFYPIIIQAATDIKPDHFICTHMEIKDGYYTGKVTGESPEGAQKLLQLTAWANEQFGEGGWQLAAAYGDHRSDQYLLATAKRAVAVNPDRGLTQIAKDANWEIADWSFKP